MLVAINEAHFELRQVALAADVGGRGFVSFDGKLVFSLHLSDFVGVGVALASGTKRLRENAARQVFFNMAENGEPNQEAPIMATQKLREA